MKRLLIGLFSVLLIPFLGGTAALAAHGEGTSWVENPNLAGCEHCHDTIIEWDTGETRQITDRDDNVSVTGGRNSQTHVIVNMGLTSSRTSDVCIQVFPPPPYCEPVPSLWNAVVDYMSEKEPSPLPYDAFAVKTYLMNCYDDVAGNAYQGCLVGPNTIDDNCNCVDPPPTTTLVPTTTLAPTTTITTSTTLIPTTTITTTTTTTTSTTNNSTTTTILGSISDLAVTISDNPDPVDAGQRLTFTMIGTNNGPDAVSGLVSISPSLTVFPVSITSDKGSCQIRVADFCPTCPDYYSSCTFQDMAVGESVVVTYEVSASGETTSNTASIYSGAVNDPDTSNNTATEVTVVQGGGGGGVRPTIVRPPRPPRPTVIRPTRPSVR